MWCCCTIELFFSLYYDNKKLYSILIKWISIIAAVNCSVWRRILGAVAQMDVYFFLPIKNKKNKNPHASRALMIWIFQKLLMRLHQIQMSNFCFLFSLSSDSRLFSQGLHAWADPRHFLRCCSTPCPPRGSMSWGCSGAKGGWSNREDRQEVGVSRQTDRQTDR